MKQLNIIEEGGAAGHLQHLYDNRELTFAELKDVIKSAAEGKLEKVSEKLDGMNIMFTFVGKELRVARNGGDIKGGGMDAAGLAKKFFGRGNVEDAFNQAFDVLRQAVVTLPPSLRKQVFHDGSRWYSVEVIYTANPGTINYDSNSVVFHQSPVLDVDAAGKVTNVNDVEGVDLLATNIDNMQKSVKAKDWRVKGPSLLNIKKISDGSIVQQALSDLDAVMSRAGVSDDNNIYDYLRSMVAREVSSLKLDRAGSVAVVERVIGAPGAPSVNDIKKVTPKEQHAEISAFIKGADKLMQRLVAPIEHVIHRFAIEALKGLSSTLIANSDAEVQRLRDQVSKAISAIEASGNEAAMEVLKRQMEKLGSVENIGAAMEGIVFFYKGQAYKFTGAFAPAHQILGLFKYGRPGIPKLDMGEGSLRSKTKDTLRESYLRKSVRAQLVEDVIKSSRFDALLAEATGDGTTGVGAEFERAEEEARVKYAEAKAALAAWDENNAKKAAFDAAFAQLRKQGIGEEKARKQLKSQPEYDYNPSLAAKRRETLEQLLDKAEARYAAYNPEVRGYRRERRGGSGARTTDDKQLPSKDKKGVLDINKISFMKWHAWPAQVKRTKLSYGSKAAGDDNEQAAMGTGPGEEWLAYVFGGQVQGGSVSYDVVMTDGSAWEVKQLLSKSETIRPGTEGLKAFEHSKRRLNSVMQQLKNFTVVCDKVKLSDTLTPDDAKKLEFVKSFVEDEYEMIVSKGEVSKGKFIDLRSVLTIVSNIKNRIDPDKKDVAQPDTRVALNDKETRVDKSTFIDVAKRVKKATGREDILTDFEEIDIAMATLKDKAFDDPRAFFNEWFQSIKIDNVFSQVDGVFIVNPQGFMAIPRDQLANALKFEKVTQGRPRFILATFGSGPQ